MAQKRSMAFAYGHQNEGSLVLGGENVEDFSLHAYEIQESYSSLLVRADFWVNGDDAEAFEANRKALANLQHYDGDLGITGQSDINLTNVSISTTTGTMTITDDDATGSFADTHIGLPVDLEGVGAFQIADRTDSNNVTVTLPPELSAPNNQSGLTLHIGFDILTVRNRAALGGFFGRPKLREINDPQTERFRRRYILEVVFEKEADATADSGGRRNANISVEEAPSELRIATFTGTYTPINATATTAASARSQFEANVESWIATVLTSLGGTWGPISTRFSEPDDSGVLSFEVVKEEINFPESLSSTNDANITAAEVSMARRSAWQIGLSGVTPPSVVDIEYIGNVPTSQSSWSGLMNVYKNTIKPNLLSRAETLFGSGAVVRREDVRPIVTKNQVVARIELFVVGSGSDFIQFEKQVEYDLDTNIETAPRFSGAQHDFEEFSPTPIITAKVIVQTTRVGLPSNNGSNTLASPQSPASNVTSDSDQKDSWQVPGPPPFPQALVAGNAPMWRPRPARVTHRPGFWGNDVEGASDKIRVTQSTFITTWLWGTANRSGFASGTQAGDPEVTAETFPESFSGGSSGPAGVFSPGTDILGFDFIKGVPGDLGSAPAGPPQGTVGEGGSILIPPATGDPFTFPVPPIRLGGN